MKTKLLNIYKKHKLASVIALIVIIAASYYVYKSKAGSSDSAGYVLGAVERGSLIVTVSGSGQVTSLNQVDIKPKITADIMAIKVKAGQKVKAGDVLIQLEAVDLINQANQAKNSYDIAKANLDLKLAGPVAEEVALAKKSVESAKAAYELSLSNLTYTEKNTAENLTRARLELANTQTNLDQTLKDYDSTAKSQNVSSDTVAQNLANAYESGKTAISAAAIALRSSLVLMDNILGMTHASVITSTYLLGALNSQTATDARYSFNAARASLDKFEAAHKAAAVNWKRAEEDELLDKTLATLQDMKTAAHNVYLVLMNTVAGADLTPTNLDSYKTSISSQESSLISNMNSIQSAKQAITSAKLNSLGGSISSSSSLNKAEAALASAKSSLAAAQNNLKQTELDNQKSLAAARADVAAKKVSLESSQIQYDQKIAKPRPVDIAALKAQLQQARHSYLSALEDLSGAQIKSPIDGLVAKIYYNVGDSAASANPIITVVTPQQLAAITLNEVDAAKIKSGQKATLTFNAVDSLSLTGTVADIDTIGTVTQGVVNYTTKIALDTQDARIKPQMSVTADIVVNKKLDALLAPNSAVKTDNSGVSFVEVLSGADSSRIDSTSGVVPANPPARKSVEVGLANDVNTEILSGLNEGDQIVVRTVTAGANSSAGQTTSGLRLFGGGGGGAFRTTGR